MTSRRSLMEPKNLNTAASQKCTLGCPILDAFLSGGFPCSSVTEIVSESGCGKTQICLQLLLSAQIPTSHGGLASSAVYIHSESPFPSRRLHILSQTFNPNPNPLDRIFVRAANSAHQLLDVLSATESLITSPCIRFPVKMIVIDSIAALFRSDFGDNGRDLMRRSSLFFRISATLKALASRYGAAVVVTNQVVDVMDGNCGLRIGNMSRMVSSGRRVCPALGISWANCVNSRLFLSKSNDEEEGGGNGGLQRGRKRYMHVVFAPHLPSSSCEFVILREGVFGVETTN